MVKTDNLHELISTLSQNEKRYFKIYCDRHVIGQENQSVLLFDMVASQKVYDGEFIMEKLTFVNTPDRLKKKKHQLYKLVLKCMAFYHSQRSSDQRLLEMVQQILFLYQKGLYRQCLSLIEKGESEARLLEKHSIAMLFLESKRRVLHRIANPDGVVKAIDDIRLIAADYQKELVQMNNALSILNDVRKEGVFRTAKHAEKTRETLRVMKETAEANTFLSEYYRISAEGIYHAACGEHNLHLEADRSLVNLFEEYPHFIRDWSTAYAFALNNLCNALFSVGKMNEHQSTLVKIKRLKNDKLLMGDKDFSNHLAIMTFEHGLISSIYAGNFVDALKSVEAFKPQLESGLVTEASRLPILYDIAYMYFIIGQYKQCKQYINRLLFEETASSRNDLFGFAELMNILIHFEMGRSEFAEYLKDSLKRRLINDNRLYRAEKMTLELLRNIISEPDRKIVERQIRDAIQEFESFESSFYERDIWQYFDFISWLEAKLSGRTMQEVFVNRMKRLW